MAISYEKLKSMIDVFSMRNKEQTASYSSFQLFFLDYWCALSCTEPPGGEFYPINISELSNLSGFGKGSDESIIREVMDLLSRSLEIPIIRPNPLFSDKGEMEFLHETILINILTGVSFSEKDPGIFSVRGISNSFEKIANDLDQMAKLGFL